MSLFSEFRTRPKVQNRSYFAKFLPFAGLCDFFVRFFSAR